MEYINQVNDNGTPYDVHDKRIPEILPSDAGKALKAKADGTSEWGNAGLILYNHVISFGGESSITGTDVSCTVYLVSKNPNPYSPSNRPVDSDVLLVSLVDYNDCYFYNPYFNFQQNYVRFKGAFDRDGDTSVSSDTITYYDNMGDTVTQF